MTFCQGLPWAFIVLLLLNNFSLAPVSASASTASELVDEIVAQSKSPRQYDWRNELFGIEYSALTINERNSFGSSGFSLALRSTFESRYLGLVGFRSITTESTVSSSLLAATPFTQAAQPSRLEVFLIAGIPLLAGRSFTLMSPRIADWEHILYLKLGGHHNFFGRPFLASGSGAPALPGQRVVKYQEVFDLGLRLQFSVPHSLSLFLDYDYFYPAANYDADLKEWSIFAGGISWSFF